MAPITIRTLEGMLEGDSGWGHLEDARSKLLLGPVVDGSEAQQEIKIRIDWWDSVAYVDLLTRAELRLTRKITRRKRQKLNHRDAKADKAKWQVVEGAYRKAVGSLTLENSGTFDKGSASLGK